MVLYGFSVILCCVDLLSLISIIITGLWAIGYPETDDKPLVIQYEQTRYLWPHHVRSWQYLTGDECDECDEYNRFHGLNVIGNIDINIL